MLLSFCVSLYLAVDPREVKVPQGHPASVCLGDQSVELIAVGVGVTFNGILSRPRLSETFTVLTYDHPHMYLQVSLGAALSPSTVASAAPSPPAVLRMTLHPLPLLWVAHTAAWQAPPLSAATCPWVCVLICRMMMGKLTMWQLELRGVRTLMMIHFFTRHAVCDGVHAVQTAKPPRLASAIPSQYS